MRFEVEAYSNMTTNKYIEKRDWYDWTSYMIFPDDTYNIEDLIYLHQLHPDEEDSIVIKSTEPAEQIVEESPEPIVEQSSEPIVEQSSEPIVEQSSEPIVEQSSDEPSEPIVEESLEESLEPIVEQSLEESKEDSESTTLETNTHTESEDIYNKSTENIDEEVSFSINISFRNRSRKTHISMD